MRTASDVLKDHMFSILDDVLVLLSGQGFPTPEKTYKLDGGWGLALSDLRRCFNEHRARIADLEAELRELRRLTTPEPISDLHKDGNWWLVWEPGWEGWYKVRWRHESWLLGGVLFSGTPTHALPMPPAPEVPNA